MNRFAFLMLTEQETRLPIYTLGTGHWDDQEDINRPEGVPFFQWLQCSSGMGEFRCNGEVQYVKPGTGLFIFPNVPHEYHGVSVPWEIDWIAFDGELAVHLAGWAGLTRSGVYSLSDSELLLSHLRNTLALALSGRPLAGLECSKLIYMLMIDIMKHISDNTSSIEQNYARLQPVFDYMEERYKEPVTLEELAQTIGVSAQHLCLLFRRNVKLRPMEYLNLLRIRKSKEIMLNELNARIGEVARRVGFDTPGYFSTLFKRNEGITPEAFRKLNGVH